MPMRPHQHKEPPTHPTSWFGQRAGKGGHKVVPLKAGGETDLEAQPVAVSTRWWFGGFLSRRLGSWHMKSSKGIMKSTTSYTTHKTQGYCLQTGFVEASPVHSSSVTAVHSSSVTALAPEGLPSWIEKIAVSHASTLPPTLHSVPTSLPPTLDSLRAAGQFSAFTLSTPPPPLALTPLSRLVPAAAGERRRAAGVPQGAVTAHGAGGRAGCESHTSHSHTSHSHTSHSVMSHESHTSHSDTSHSQRRPPSHESDTVRESHESHTHSHPHPDTHPSHTHPSHTHGGEGGAGRIMRMHTPSLPWAAYSEHRHTAREGVVSAGVATPALVSDWVYVTACDATVPGGWRKLSAPSQRPASRWAPSEYGALFISPPPEEASSFDF